MTRPSRSRILPRGARTGMALMLFCSARTWYSSGLRTCRSQKLASRKMKIPTERYWKMAIFPDANFGSSRSRRCAPILSSRRRNGSFTGAVLLSGRCLQFIQNVEQGQRHGRVQQGENESLLGIERDHLAEQGPCQHPVKELVEEVKEEGQDETDHGIFHVEADADRSREIAHQRLHDAQHPDGMVAERILNQADSCAIEHRRDSFAPCQREVNRHQQRQLQISQEGNVSRYVKLEQNGDERNRDQ